MITIAEEKDIVLLEGYSEDLMEKVLRYLQMMKDDYYQEDRGHILVLENTEDVRNQRKFWKEEKIEDQVSYVDKFWFSDGTIFTVWSVMEENLEIVLMIPYEITPKDFLRSIQ